MGFRAGGYMTVWSVDPGRFGNTMRVRLSSSRKNKSTEEYEQDFSGFCTFIGKANDKAANLHPKDRIKLLECDVGTKYDKEKKIEYVNYRVFDFEQVESMPGGGAPAAPAAKPVEVEANTFDEDNLPF